MNVLGCFQEEDCDRLAHVPIHGGANPSRYTVDCVEVLEMARPENPESQTEISIQASFKT